jgi:hypothetical protein
MLIIYSTQIKKLYKTAIHFKIESIVCILEILITLSLSLSIVVLMAPTPPDKVLFSSRMQMLLVRSKLLRIVPYQVASNFSTQ